MPKTLSEFVTKRLDAIKQQIVSTQNASLNTENEEEEKDNEKIEYLSYEHILPKTPLLDALKERTAKPVFFTPLSYSNQKALFENNNKEKDQNVKTANFFRKYLTLQDYYGVTENAIKQLSPLQQNQLKQYKLLSNVLTPATGIALPGFLGLNTLNNIQQKESVGASDAASMLLHAVLPFYNLAKAKARVTGIRDILATVTPTNVAKSFKKIQNIADKTFTTQLALPFAETGFFTLLNHVNAATHNLLNPSTPIVPTIRQSTTALPTTTSTSTITPTESDNKPSLLDKLVPSTNTIITAASVGAGLYAIAQALKNNADGTTKKPLSIEIPAERITDKFYNTLGREILFSDEDEIIKRRKPKAASYTKAIGAAANTAVGITPFHSTSILNAVRQIGPFVGLSSFSNPFRLLFSKRPFTPTQPYAAIPRPNALMRLNPIFRNVNSLA